MSNSFNKILIPVDLSLNTEVAIEKGIALAGENTVLNLLHIRNALPFELVQRKMRELEEMIAVKGSVKKVETIIQKGKNVERIIEHYAERLHSDLVIIAKKSSHNWFPFLNKVVPSRLVKKTGVPVLTVKPGAFNNRIRTILVPVNDYECKPKLEVIASLCNKFNVKIHLVTFLNEELQPTSDNASSLLNVYQWIKSSHSCQIEYAALKENNRAKTLLKYAQEINADMMLLYAETETRIGWMDKHISDLIPPGSKMQVLSIQPA